MVMHMVTDADLPQEFLRSYDQVQIGSSFGGHGLRDWARHSDAAFVGQWALAIQSAKIGCGPEGTPDTWFPILEDVVQQANDLGIVLGALPLADQTPCDSIVVDLLEAWNRCVEATRRAVELGLPSHHRDVVALGDWLVHTKGQLCNIGDMPDQAQRELSATVISQQIFDFGQQLTACRHWDALKRRANWLAECSRAAGRWTQVVPWDRMGYLNLTNTSYIIAFARRYRMERPDRFRGPDACRCGFCARAGGVRRFDGDHDESDCMKRGWNKTLVHHTIVDALVRMLKHCGGFVEGSIKSEYKYWDPARVGTDGTRRVPDVTCTDKQGKEYVIDARIFWNAMSESSNGFMAYTDTGVGAVRGEAEKRRSWDAAMLRRAEAAPAGVEFIPFSLEASGVWGPAARRFFAKCLYLADDDRDIDVYHWSSAKFSSTWHDTFSILLARGRAQVSVAASRGDWPKRTQDQAYSDQNHASAA